MGEKVSRCKRSMSEYSKKFLEKTIEVWQPYSNSVLTLEDAREIADNMIGLYSLLFELELKNSKRDLKESKEIN